MPCSIESEFSNLEIKADRMHVVILAAGRGRRLGSLTDQIPKPLISAGKKRLIDYSVEAAMECKPKSIIIITGYRNNQIEEYLKNQYKKAPFIFVYNKNYMNSNNIESLALALDKLVAKDAVLLFESDLVFEKKLVKRLIKHQADQVAVVDRFHADLDGTTVRTKGSLITHFNMPHAHSLEKPRAKDYKTVNIYKLSAEYWNGPLRALMPTYARNLEPQAYYETVFAMLSHSHKFPMHAMEIQGSWFEIDDQNDLEKAEYELNPQTRYQKMVNIKGGYWDFRCIDFCFIRNHYFPTKKMQRKISEKVIQVSENYGSEATTLSKKLSSAVHLPAEKLVVLNGAAEAFPILARLWESKQIAIPKPTFGEYKRVFPNVVEYDEDFKDLEALEAVLAKVDVFCIVNPNNPTGRLISSELLIEMFAKFPQKTFLLDESFIDFAESRDCFSSISRSPPPNVVILKSLSKCWGLPGVRLGYIFSTSQDFCTKFQRLVPIWNINSLAELFLEEVTKQVNALEESFDMTIEQRGFFTDQLKKSPLVLKVWPSSANFLMVDLNIPADKFDEFLEWLAAESRIFLKDLRAKFPDSLARVRVSVRPTKDIQALLKAFERYSLQEGKIR